MRKDKIHRNENERHEQQTNTVDHDDAGKQEDSSTSIHMLVFKEQETNTQRIIVNNHDSKELHVKTETQSPIKLNEPVLSVPNKRSTTVVLDMPAGPEMGTNKHTVIVNFLGSAQHGTNKLWLQNQPTPPTPTWTDWWKGNKYPEGFVGPLDYTPQNRNPFVKLVLTIVLIMLLATAGIIAYVWTTPDVKEYFQFGGWTLLLPALIVFVTVDYAMICSPCARMMPCNCILLILTVLAMGVIASIVTIRFKSDVVMYACLSTAVVVMVCIFLACSNFDFTSWMLYVVVIATVFGIVTLIVVMMMWAGIVIKPLLIAILAIGTLIQCVTLTIQLQMILGGKALELSEEDYGLGAFMLYTSIVDIFLKMVQIVGLSTE